MRGHTITNHAVMGEYDQIDRDPSNNEASADISVGGTIRALSHDADFAPGRCAFDGAAI